MNLVSYLVNRVAQLRDSDEGLALTEYLILLGLLTAAVIGAVTLFGGNLAAAWGGWAAWLGSAGLGGPAVGGP